MTTIAILTKTETGSFEGQLKTPFLDRPLKLEQLNQEKTNDNQPDFRVLISALESGAGWKKISKKDKEYISVTIDCPSLPNPIYANLNLVNGAYHLIWNR